MAIQLAKNEGERTVLRQESLEDFLPRALQPLAKRRTETKARPTWGTGGIECVRGLDPATGVWGVCTATGTPVAHIAKIGKRVSVARGEVGSNVRKRQISGTRWIIIR
jgi:hypothetical protein